MMCVHASWNLFLPPPYHSLGGGVLGMKYSIYLDTKAQQPYEVPKDPNEKHIFKTFMHSWSYIELLKTLTPPYHSQMGCVLGMK